MGMEVQFDLKPAVEAGLVIRLGVVAYETESVQTLEYLMEVPGRHAIVVNASVWTDDITDPTRNTVRCSVTANKWGQTYKPLTEWLGEHDIEWQEY